MGLLLLLIRMVLTATFGTAGMAKTFDPVGTRKALAEFGLPQSFVRPVALLLPTAELATAVLLLPVAAASWGASAALCLLVLFVLAISVNLLRGRSPECHCFGQVHSRPISWATATRNAVLASGAAVILWKGPGMSTTTAVHRFAEAASAQALPTAALAFASVAFIVQMLFLFALFSQHGRLLLRVGNLEKNVRGAGALALSPPSVAGLAVGAPAPQFQVSSGGAFVSVERLLADNKPLLLVFTDPDCGACAELLPDLVRWERQYSEFITFVVISRASTPDNGQPRPSNGPRNTAWQREREISESYRVNGMPAAIVLRPDATIGTWLAAGRPAIQGLIQFLLYTRMLSTSYDMSQLTAS